MASLNKVFLLGNLTRNPELRYTPGGAAVCNFGIAVNRRFSTAQGEDREETCFVEIEVWGRQAQLCQQYLTKGAPALVEGRLRYDSWEDRETGRRRSRLLVRADRVQFLRAPARSSAAFTDEPAAPPPAAGRRAEPAEPPPFEEPPSDDSEDDIPF